MQELLILRAVDHPNIIKLNEVYLDHQYLHIVTELMEGGEVDPKNQPNSRYTEQEAAKMVRQCLKALNYLHGLKIVHRDIKTENVLLCKNKQFAKLIDFGFSKFCS